MSETEDEPTESARPALVKLTNDINEQRERFLSGLSSRREIVEFGQALTIRTLGEVPDRFYAELARELRFPLDEEQSVFIAALLDDESRARELDPEKAAELRQEIWMLMIYPASHRALRKLRKSAGEYLDNPEGGPGNHAAALQRHIAMRPALDELDRKQRSVLESVLDGFDDRDEIVEWSSEMELATHGEIPDHFVVRCYKEHPTSLFLTADNDIGKRWRELFAATYLLPYFNRGVRDLSGRAGEIPAAERQEKEVPLA